jgi:two-component system, OmpR family, response regulator
MMCCIRGAGNVSQLTVLIVDDDPSILDFLGEALRWEGYAVLTAADSEALRLAHTFQPDVILLDLLLPGMDGREISSRLRADAKTSDIPIILMSASDRMNLIAATMPINDRLEKPFPLRVLYDTVAAWC